MDAHPCRQRRLSSRVAKADSEDRSSVRTAFRLKRLSRRGMDLLVLNCRRIPAGAQCFYKVNRGDHLLTKQLGREPLVRQQYGLRSDDIEEGGQSADIAIIGDVECTVRVGDRRILTFGGPRQGT